jgi:hypothetical protein
MTLNNAAIAAVTADPNLTPLDLKLAIMRAKDVALDTRVRVAIKTLRFVHKKANGDRPEDANVDEHPASENAVTGSGKSETGKGEANIAAGKNQDLMPLDFLLGLLSGPAQQQASHTLDGVSQPFRYRSGGKAKSVSLHMSSGMIASGNWCLYFSSRISRNTAICSLDSRAARDYARTSLRPLSSLCQSSR